MSNCECQMGYQCGEIEKLRAELAAVKAEHEQFKTAVDEHLHFKMRSIMSDTPENLLKADRDRALAAARKLRAELIDWVRMFGSEAQKKDPSLVAAIAEHAWLADAGETDGK